MDDWCLRMNFWSSIISCQRELNGVLVRGTRRNETFWICGLGGISWAGRCRVSKLLDSKNKAIQLTDLMP